MSSVSLEVLNNAWRVAAQTYIQQNGGAMSMSEAQVLARIISPRNKAAGGAARIGMQTLQAAVDSTGKSIMQVVVKWANRRDGNAPRVDTSNGFCDDARAGVTYSAETYQLNRNTADNITINDNIAQCSQEAIAQYLSDNMNELVRGAVSKLIWDVEDELYAKIAPTPAYRHIGNLPKLQAATTRYPGEDLPLFTITDNKINPVGDTILERDKDLGGVMERFFVGDYTLSAYIKWKGISGVGDNGYDYSKLNAIGASDFVRSNRLASATGLRRPVLVIPNGAVQLVTFAEFDKKPEVSGNMTKTSVVDPVFGLTWNLVTRVKECEGRRLVTEVWLDIAWALIVEPKCKVNDLRLDGTNGLYLYNIVCSDDTICDLTPVDALYNSAATPLPECVDGQNATFCDSSCDVALEGFLSTDGEDYIVTANANPSLGATIATYEWEVNGSPILDDTRVITLDSSTLSDGDIVTVTVTDSLGCIATISHTVVNGCPEPVYILDTNQGEPQTVTNGQTVALGSFAAPVGALQIVLGVGNTNDVPLVVTAATATGTGAGGVVSDFPATLDNGDEGQIESATSVKTVGAKSIVFTIASNDCANPTFSITVTYTITA
jgi:hypothetical protein